MFQTPGTKFDHPLIPQHYRHRQSYGGFRRLTLFATKYLGGGRRFMAEMRKIESGGLITGRSAIRGRIHTYIL